ncbi:glycoside hydrolase family 28 protein [Mycena albidolilacea]|uniref:galacturonan 1,4-alpha-galacturonidase n=1 Tax=Mycena albidolilacea TaxID=1033008 RepID=A0AAD7F4E9_9AGAR|nr:glycoside hydrolase family 28 protein [Mycena albidolilacea]
MQLTLLPILLALSSLPAILANAPSHTVQNVGRASCTLAPLGAGKDDSPQFLTAMQACSTVVVPATSTLNISTRLNMTGLTNKHLSLQGTLRFDPNIPYWSTNGFPFTFQTQITFWILGGTNIVAWYDAFASNSSLLRPIILTIFQAKNVLVQNIKMLNSPEWFNLVNEGQNVTYSGITINAASTSSHGPSNTDGWDIYRSDNVVIKDSVINNGDDCVSFKVNSTNVLVSNLNCTGSHGISVGSLGQFAGMFDIVENVTSINVRMSNAQNGARIKAWAGSGVGSGIVKNITFINFIESKVDNPVVIDQCYMTSAAACAQFPSNTLIQDVVFTQISGTSTGSTVANLACSPGARCSNITVNNLALTPPSGTAKYACQNVKLSGSSASLFGTCATT